MHYPLEITFKFWSFAPQLSVLDATGQPIFYINQKLFKLREAIGVFANQRRTQLKYEIKADRIIDFSARYTFQDANWQAVGAVKRRGLKSIWRARYDIYAGDAIAFTIHEENPWVKVMDSIFAEIPIAGLLTGFFFNPVYRVTRPDNSVVMRLEKKPALLSRIFSIKQVDALNQTEEIQILLSLMMMLLLERNRS